jgi:hypothetical protein
MSKPGKLDVLGTLETATLRIKSHVLITHDANEIGLIFELNSFWRVIRTRAEIEHTIARLTLMRAGRARPVEIVSYDALDATDRTIATQYEAIHEAVRKRKREPEPERAPDTFAALAAVRRD